MIRFLFVAAEEYPNVPPASSLDEGDLSWQLRIGPLSLANVIPNPGAWEAGDIPSVSAFDDEAPIILPRSALWSRPRVWLDVEEVIPLTLAQDEGWKLARPTAAMTNYFNLATESDVFLGTAPPPVGPIRNRGLHIGFGLGVR